MGFKYSSKHKRNHYKDRIIRDGTRSRGYEGNDTEMYSQWYEKWDETYDDNSTQGKSRRYIRGSSKDDNSTQGKSRRYIRSSSKDDNSTQKIRTKLRSSSKDDDYLQGGKGRDKLRGGKGDDELLGGRGHDRLSGGKGDDYLIGGDGNDYLKGGKGDDILIGGAGQDKLKGGKGADIFDVKSETEKGSKCIIKDFNPDEGDKISAADNVSIEMKGDRAIIEADGATTICRLDSDYRPNNAKKLDDWFTDSAIVNVVEG